MAKSKANHTHKYERRKLGSWKTKGHDIYKCAIPGCTHYMIDMQAVVGRYSCCWGNENCQNEVEMTRYLVFNERRKHPICETCKQARKFLKQSAEEREQKRLLDEKIERFMQIIEDSDANTIDS